MIRFDLEHPSLRLAAVHAEPVRCEPSPPELLEQIHRLEGALRAEPSAFPEAVRKAVRDVLRAGGYKPTGRGKPASEFLLGAATAQGLPAINNLVDINNFVSLKFALPISIFDAGALGDDISIRFGKRQESYVFNESGQRMDIEGIPVVCRGPAADPVGNAVKDSMIAKVSAATERTLAIIYGTRALEPGYLESAASELARLLGQFAAAERCSWQWVPD